MVIYQVVRDDRDFGCGGVCVGGLTVIRNFKNRTDATKFIKMQVYGVFRVMKVKVE
jgi:hypothetical protein